MSRRRSLPWIYRYSRLLMGAIAVIGSLLTTYLTIVAFSGGKTACPLDGGGGISSCDMVLQSSYAKIFGLPLSLFGLLAYLAMIVFALSPYLVNPESNKLLRNKIDDLTWRLLLAGGTAMAVFSGYLLYISLFKLHELCIYCLTSVLCSVALFVLAIIGREWEEMGQVLFTGIVVGMITLVGTLGIYANAGAPNQVGRQPIPEITVAPKPPFGWEITTTSGEAELTLGKHLTQVGAKMYGAFWCPHCYEQKQLLGKEAFEALRDTNYVECDPSGNKPQTEACIAAKIQSYPTWIINGKTYSGVQLPEKLAQESGYKGSLKFKYTMPGR